MAQAAVAILAKEAEKLKRPDRAEGGTNKAGDFVSGWHPGDKFPSLDRPGSLSSAPGEIF
jgi:hypothetical protein